MALEVVQGSDGLAKVILHEPAGSTAEVLLYGGQVISWKNQRREELLFISSKAFRKPPKAIRGGIPVCFPQVVALLTLLCRKIKATFFSTPSAPFQHFMLVQQFGNLGALEQHGFARNKFWSLDPDPAPLPPTNQSSVDLLLKSTDQDTKTWPHSFELRLRVTLSAGKLTLIPRVRNTDSKPFSFTFALRNYLSVSDIRFISPFIPLRFYDDKIAKGSVF
uniref:Glucose-6-phosphate 1-epimerase n=1 Tax=Kalanchoe fedtschenkoi TaxID=63787 RepID=A0A7N0TNQ5_KALFE